MRRLLRVSRGIALGLLLGSGPGCAGLDRTPLYDAELIFPPEHLHNHASSLVECPNGDLLVCWYNGSGEQRADDAKIEGARKRAGALRWGPRFLMADTPGFPDVNPCLFRDPQDQLWLVWPVLLANEWHSALLHVRRATSYQGEGPPAWEETAAPLLLAPGPAFAETIARQCARDEARLDALAPEVREAVSRYVAARRRYLDDPLFHRLGWMTRAPPLILDGSRWLLPLYSDGFRCSMMAATEDGGRTWTTSAPLVGLGNLQPSVVQRRDGTLVAYMRDQGPPPKRLQQSQSRDGSRTWSPVTDTAFPNPNSAAHVLRLRNGHWVLAGNDTEDGRHRLVVAISENEGRTWRWRRPLEADAPGPDATEASYPTLVEARDGTLHVTYTYTLNGARVTLDPLGRPQRQGIKHAQFNEAWVKSGDRP